MQLQTGALKVAVSASVALWTSQSLMWHSERLNEHDDKKLRMAEAGDTQGLATLKAPVREDDPHAHPRTALIKTVGVLPACLVSPHTVLSHCALSLCPLTVPSHCALSH